MECLAPHRLSLQSPGADHPGDPPGLGGRRTLHAPAQAVGWTTGEEVRLNELVERVGGISHPSQPLLTHQGDWTFLLILFLQHVSPGFSHQLPERPLVGDARHEGVLGGSKGGERGQQRGWVPPP